MSSARETALAALATVLTSALAALNPAPSFARASTEPVIIPAGGAVILGDGEGQVVDTMLSPLSYVVEQAATVELAVPGTTAALRTAALDLLLLTIGNAVTAARTLSGAADWVEVGVPQLGVLDWAGAAADGNALLPLTITFTVAGHPLA